MKELLKKIVLFFYTLRARLRKAPPVEAGATAAEEAEAAPQKPWQRLLSRIREKLERKREETQEPGKEQAAPEEEDGEEAPEENRPSLLARAKALLGQRKVQIALAVAAGLAVALVIEVRVIQLAMHQKEIEELRQNNRRLAEQNKKLQEATEQTEKKAAAPGGEQNPGQQDGEAFDSDCTVTGTADAATTLKRCIESYNAVAGR